MVLNEALDLLQERAPRQPAEDAIKRFAFQHVQHLVEVDKCPVDIALLAMRAFFTLGLTDMDDIEKRARQKYGAAAHA